MRLSSPLVRLLLVAVAVGLSSPFLAVPVQQWSARLLPISHAQNDNDSKKGNDNNGDPFGASTKMVERADRTASLETYAHDASGSIIPGQFRMRTDLLAE